MDSRALAPTVEALSRHLQVYTPEQRGHGHTPDVEGPITFELMAQDTIAFIETVVDGPALLLGCSDGAILALTVALRRPDLVRRLVFASRTTTSARSQAGRSLWSLIATWSSPGSSPGTRYRHSRPSAAPPPGSRRTLQVG